MVDLPLRWSEIEKELDKLRDVEGGFTLARRGLITLPDGTDIFVKLGLHENTKQWAKKEIDVYRFLQKHEYPYVPTLLAVNGEETSFALTAYTPEDGWNWKGQWTEARVDKMLEAMDVLAALQPEIDDIPLFAEKTINESDDGWQELVASPKLYEKFINKLKNSGMGDFADKLDITKEAQRSSAFLFNNNQLVHNDVRADNCAWNAATGEVRLVDWNWTQLGDRRIDIAATLTHVQKAGVDLLPKYTERLDADAFHWMAGFWFKSAAKPIWEGGPDYLRDIQLRAGMTALDITRRLDK